MYYSYCLPSANRNYRIMGMSLALDYDAPTLLTHTAHICMSERLLLVLSKHGTSNVYIGIWPAGI